MENMTVYLKYKYANKYRIRLDWVFQKGFKELLNNQDLNVQN